MAGLTTRMQPLPARAIVDLSAVFGAAGGRVRRAGPVCGTTGH
jgi:hypothetical protein